MAGKKQLYVVTIETEIVVCAESESEAEDIAESEARHQFEFDHRAQPMRHLPAGWSGDSLVFGIEEDRTVDELVAEGLAPRYTPPAAKEKPERS